MKKLSVFLCFLLSAVSVFADENDELRYRAEIQIYQNRCSRGDYEDNKTNESSDIERINSIGRTLGKPNFKANCEKKEKIANKSYSGGGYVPNSSEIYHSTKQLQPQSTSNKIAESYEERSKRIIRESNEYQNGIAANVQTTEFQHEERLVDFDGMTSTLPDCPKYGEKVYCYGREGEPGDGYLGEFKDGLHDGFGALVIKEKNIFVVGYFKGNALHGRARYNPLDNLNDLHEGVFNNGQFTERSISSTTTTLSEQQQPNSPFTQRCSGYGFQQGSDGFANCIMQMEQAQTQANLEIQRRAQLERSCGFARANGFLAPTRTGNFAESAQNATEAYSRCMAGLPPPHNYIINCSRSGNNFNCYAQ